jgi:alanyl-tRNA synthetase
MRWTTDRIRQSFLDFFAARGHTIVPSAPLVPKGDPTLLFTNAGMVQFKDYFLGVRTPSSPRVADCQKCLRISGKHNDLDAVGRDSYHHTFFEMLGNWSFGDYYKAEAIEWHWELVTRVWEIPKERLWATVYKDDDEAEQAWLKLKVLPRDRILRFGEKDNFWEMGETGPCGPCSEIHIDRGSAAAAHCTHSGQSCGVNVEGCARFIELGNLVFIQYNRDAGGKLTPLPMKHVDTGTGLERVASVLQSFEESQRLGREVVLGNYDIDVFQSIIEKVKLAASTLGKGVRQGFGVPTYGQHFAAGNARAAIQSDFDVSFRAIADHSRAMCFLIADGIRPGNTEREYVLRRIIRRAARHGRYISIEQPFLSLVADGVIESMGDAYPDLREKAAVIKEVISREEQQFSDTLGRGLEFLHLERRRVQETGGKLFSGEIAFKLYDTYGFPIDLTQDVLRDDGIEVDIAEFNRLMEQQRERARAARKDEIIVPEIIHTPGTSSHFLHDTYEAQSQIIAAHADDGNLTIITAETPFYPEGGGQVGDRGVIETTAGGLLEITDTRKHDGAILHMGRILRGDKGEFEQGRRVRLRVDRERRDAAMLNHSATHILHHALRETLGKEVHQAGSLVAPERLRFDFAHRGPVAEGSLQTIEDEVNGRIRENAIVATEEMAYDEALKAGALAFFGDKYGDRVRVVRMGDFSIELCGGTHVARTGDIGLFKLEGESGVAAGVRRIEALTGEGALAMIRRREQILRQIAGQLGARDSDALERIERLLAREKELERKLRAVEQKAVSGTASAGETVQEVHGIKLVTRRVEGVDAAGLRGIADRLRQQYGSAVVALGSDLGESKVALLVAVTPDLASRIKAGDIIKQIAPIVGGSGGGRPDFAQAGGRDPAKLDEALARIAALIKV